MSPEMGLDVLMARQTEIVNCNWEGSASKAPPKFGLEKICFPFFA